MSNNEEALSVVIESLDAAYELKEILEQQLSDISNPNIHTNVSKKQTIKRLRLLNNVICSGEKARLSLEADISKENNPKCRVKKR